MTDPPPGLRASDADRAAAAERLRVAAIEGRLDSDELEERLSAAYSARHCGELERLVQDIIVPVTPPAPPAPPVFVRATATTNGLAVASLVCGLVWMLWLGSLAAILLGHAALRQIRRSGQSGRGLAIAGLALGYLGVATLLLFALFAITW